MEDKELKILKLDEITNLIWIIVIALVVIISIVLSSAENSEFSIFGFFTIIAITILILVPIICIILGILIMILSKLNFVKTDGNWGTLDLMKSFYSELDEDEEDFNIVKILPVKERRIVGIIFLSGGIILSIIGLMMMILFQDTNSASIVPVEGIIVLILLGLGIISMVISISFFRKFEDRGWLEDALFYWSYWTDAKFIDQKNRKQQIDCSSCNQRLNIPFNYSGKISCPACGIYIELEEGVIQAEGNPSDQG